MTLCHEDSIFGRKLLLLVLLSHRFQSALHTCGTQNKIDDSHHEHAYTRQPNVPLAEVFRGWHSGTVVAVVIPTAVAAAAASIVAITTVPIIKPYIVQVLSQDAEKAIKDASSNEIVQKG